MEATNEKREAVGLTEKEREAAVKLVDAFNQLTNDTDKRIALAYIEGMAAATPQRTA